MNKKNQLSDNKQNTTTNQNKETDEISLEKVLDTLNAQADTYKHAGMTHISSLLAEAS